MTSKSHFFWVFLFVTDSRFFEASGRVDNILNTSLSSSVLTEDFGVSLCSVLEAKVEALVDGSGSFSFTAAWQTWVFIGQVDFQLAAYPSEQNLKCLDLQNISQSKGWLPVQRKPFWAISSLATLVNVMLSSPATSYSVSRTPRFWRIHDALLIRMLAWKV